MQRYNSVVFLIVLALALAANAQSVTNEDGKWFVRIFDAPQENTSGPFSHLGLDPVKPVSTTKKVLMVPITQPKPVFQNINTPLVKPTILTKEKPNPLEPVADDGIVKEIDAEDLKKLKPAVVLGVPDKEKDPVAYRKYMKEQEAFGYLNLHPVNVSKKLDQGKFKNVKVIGDKSQTDSVPTIPKKLEKVLTETPSFEDDVKEQPVTPLPTIASIPEIPEPVVPAILSYNANEEMPVPGATAAPVYPAPTSFIESELNTEDFQELEEALEAHEELNAELNDNVEQEEQNEVEHEEEMETEVDNEAEAETEAEAENKAEYIIAKEYPNIESFIKPRPAVVLKHHPLVGTVPVAVAVPPNPKDVAVYKLGLKVDKFLNKLAHASIVEHKIAERALSNDVFHSNRFLRRLGLPEYDDLDNIDIDTKKEEVKSEETKPVVSKEIKELMSKVKSLKNDVLKVYKKYKRSLAVSVRYAKLVKRNPYSFSTKRKLNLSLKRSKQLKNKFNEISKLAKEAANELSNALNKKESSSKKSETKTEEKKEEVKPIETKIEEAKKEVEESIKKPDVPAPTVPSTTEVKPSEAKIEEAKKEVEESIKKPDVPTPVAPSTEVKPSETKIEEAKKEVEESIKKPVEPSASSNSTAPAFIEDELDLDLDEAYVPFASTIIAGQKKLMTSCINAFKFHNLCAKKKLTDPKCERAKKLYYSNLCSQARKLVTQHMEKMKKNQKPNGKPQGKPNGKPHGKPNGKPQGKPKPNNKPSLAEIDANETALVEDFDSFVFPTMIPGFSVDQIKKYKACYNAFKFDIQCKKTKQNNVKCTNAKKVLATPICKKGIAFVNKFLKKKIGQSFAETDTTTVTDMDAEDMERMDALAESEAEIESSDSSEIAKEIESLANAALAEN